MSQANLILQLKGRLFLSSHKTAIAALDKQGSSMQNSYTPSHKEAAAIALYCCAGDSPHLQLLKPFFLHSYRCRSGLERQNLELRLDQSPR